MPDRTSLSLDVTERQLGALLKTYFGYDEFRPQQKEAMLNVLGGRDVFVLMPTGGGKSLCFQLPALMREGVALVISPLISLMKDQVDALRANGIPAEYVNSMLSNEEIREIQSQTQRGEVKILYISPERFSLPMFRDFLHTLPLSLVAVDEAHCISEWGHEFRPEYRGLHLLKEEFPGVPIIALTATATEPVQKDIIKQLALQDPAVFTVSFNRPNLIYSVRPKQKSLETIIELIKRSGDVDESIIIYVATRDKTEKLAAQLQKQGFSALAYHAGLSAEKRNEVQEQFSQDKVSIIVATIAFGMGIDKPNVRLVIHADLPKSLENYYQETGRAGRDGLRSECVLLYSYGDKVKQDFFINQMTDVHEQARMVLKLNQMISYGTLMSCRRKFLMEYFNEPWPEMNCNSCDNCINPQEEVDATEIAQKILSTIIRTGERYGTGYIISVLRGAAEEKITLRGHRQLSVFGIAKDWSESQLRRVIEILATRGLLLRQGDEYPTLAVSPLGKEMLKNRTQIFLPKTIGQRGVSTKKPIEAIEYDPTLFEQLRVLRRGLAEEQRVPPYVIFGDASLRQMAAYAPQTAEEFLSISGVGQAKLAQYGEVFLAAIRSYKK